MALSNAERQARWQTKRKAELLTLREQARQAKLAPTEASIGHLIEALIAALSRRPVGERAQAVVHLGRRLGLEVEEVEPGE